MVGNGRPYLITLSPLSPGNDVNPEDGSRVARARKWPRRGVANGGEKFIV